MSLAGTSSEYSLQVAIGIMLSWCRWLAAQELKRQSWRFHKQYLTWFQRAHNPQAITEDYEQGGYYYFDWENSWCQRKKSDFRFEVSYAVQTFEARPC